MLNRFSPGLGAPLRGPREWQPPELCRWHNSEILPIRCVGLARLGPAPQDWSGSQATGIGAWEEKRERETDQNATGRVAKGPSAWLPVLPGISPGKGALGSQHLRTAAGVPMTEPEG